jgi:2-polyprenyl-3-methyl-5-hydroxy-6-metoxy-1,4-benzoquinol methylase
MPNYDSPYERQREQLLRDLLPKGHGVAVDIGCNDGRFTSLLPGAGYNPVIGYDSDDTVLAEARRANPDIDFRSGYDDFTVRNRSLTVALELIEHIPPADQLGFLRSVRDAAAPDGLLFLSTPGRYSLLATYERLRHAKHHRLEPYTWWDDTHVSVLSYARLRRLLKASGFQVMKSAGYCFAPPDKVRHRATRGPLTRFGFDIVIVARSA